MITDPPLITCVAPEGAARLPMLILLHLAAVSLSRHLLRDRGWLSLLASPIGTRAAAGSSVPSSSSLLQATDRVASHPDPVGGSAPTSDPSADSAAAGSSVAEPQSGAAPDSAAHTGASSGTPPPDLTPSPPPRPTTRAQHGIVKPKQYTDGTVRWGMITTCEPEEPSSLKAAFESPDWTSAMDAEHQAFFFF